MAHGGPQRFQKQMIDLRAVAAVFDLHDEGIHDALEFAPAEGRQPQLVDLYLYGVGLCYPRPVGVGSFDGFQVIGLFPSLGAGQHGLQAAEICPYSAFQVP